MPINNFKFNQTNQMAVWSDEKTGVTLSNVFQAIFDVGRDIVVAIVREKNTVLKIYDKNGFVLEKEAPENSDFQYLLSDKNRGVLVICSEKNSSGDVLDWYYKIDLKSKVLIKDGRSY